MFCIHVAPNVSVQNKNVTQVNKYITQVNKVCYTRGKILRA